ncbi:MAG: tRNA (adenosine(37)-N6)-threonylcarbamoyltransferase complex dimerization subunit type 1 TsaB [Gammaproteobacteria bacterium]|nr:tRNA (adenosine(37)-N6)-threonylcarbamoyltransferase complex dimerization subunit type 1 TsaB [Gammaproteobacteria bacterium]
MNILAIDTATEGCSAALCVGSTPHASGGRVLSRYQEVPRSHAELILPMIDALLAEADITLKNLTAIAFGRGPGSFTGVRLASSVVQGLAYGAGIGVVPVSTLQAVAYRAFALTNESDAPKATHALVCNDARMDEVYVGAFMRGLDIAGVAVPVALGAETVQAPDRVVVPQVAGARMGARDALRWIGAGRGFKTYPALSSLRAEQGGPLASVHETILPRAEDLLALALPEIAAGRVLPATAALPIYVRDEVVKTPGSLSRI